MLRHSTISFVAGFKLDLSILVRRVQSFIQKTASATMLGVHLPVLKALRALSEPYPAQADFRAFYSS